MTPQLNFHFITLFPETIEVWFRTSILGRALEENLFSFSTYPLRDFATDKHRTVDDKSYGGGGGMVLKVEPLVAAVESVREKVAPEKTRTIYFSPQGDRLSHAVISRQVKDTVRHLILVCGHYEGVDQRFIEGWVDTQLSLGDFVMTGGEIPAVAFADACIRQLEGVLGYSDAPLLESFSLKDPERGKALLEYPQYTRPRAFRGKEVPEVLIHGDHAAIAEWRLAESRRRTAETRPDLLI
jgi:tRNA (guanine37-N1)-methyltransferase